VRWRNREGVGWRNKERVDWKSESVVCRMAKENIENIAVKNVGAAATKAEKKEKKVPPAAKTGKADIEMALKLRAQMKSSRPPFSRNQLYRHGVKFARLEDKWRRPKGLQSKIRLRRRGAMPNPGYGSPAIVRGLHPSGLREKMAFNAADLDGVDAKTEAVRIAAAVGKRKRIEILQKAKKLGVRVLNARIAKSEKVGAENDAKQKDAPQTG